MWHKPHLLKALADLLLLAAGCGLAGCGGVWGGAASAAVSPRRVAGDARVAGGAAQEWRSSGGLLRGNFFTVNLEALRRALEHLPWVRRAEVWRKWPARIVCASRSTKAGALGRGAWRAGQYLRRGLCGPRCRRAVAAAAEGPSGSAREVLRRHEEFAGPAQTDRSACRRSWPVATPGLGG
jgi:cell division protein FtsQ